MRCSTIDRVPNLPLPNQIARALDCFHKLHDKYSIAKNNVCVCVYLCVRSLGLLKEMKINFIRVSALLSFISEVLKQELSVSNFTL